MEPRIRQAEFSPALRPTTTRVSSPRSSKSARTSSGPSTIWTSRSRPAGPRASSRRTTVRRTLRTGPTGTVGISIGWMSWTFGAGYRHSDLGTDLNNSDRVDWNAGVRYVTGPWGVGVQYQETETGLGAATVNVGDRRPRLPRARTWRSASSSPANTRSDRGSRSNWAFSTSTTRPPGRRRRQRRTTRTLQRLSTSARRSSSNPSASRRTRRADFGPPSSY